MTDFENKKILILGGAALHKKVVEAARRMGLYTIVTDNIPNAPAKLIADQSYDINVSDVDEIVEMCRKENVSAVISVCLDFCQVYYQQICEKLHLPCWGTKEQFDILTQKKLFKQLCMENGVDIIPTYSEADLQASDAEVEYPVLVKPSQNRGSRGQRVCHTAEEAVEAVRCAKECSGDGKAIIEKYMGGKQDFQVTYLVVDGTPYVVRTADRYLGDAKLDMDRVAIALSSPSKNTELYFSKVHKHVVKMLQSLNLKNAPVFFQGFVDGDTIRFYDPGLRFPGGDYDRIFADVMGFDLMEFLVELAVTGKMDRAGTLLNEKTAYLNQHIIFTLHSTIKSGTIKYVPPVEELLEIDGVYYVTYRHKPGEKIGLTRDVNQRIAEVNICGESREKTIATIQAVQKKLVVLDENNDNMIFCEFDANKL